MSDVSPEDRERLVDIRFGELFDRHMERGFSEAFDRRIMEWAELASLNHQPPSQRTHSFVRPVQPAQEQPRQRRRSLFEISLAETLGLG